VTTVLTAKITGMEELSAKLKKLGDATASENLRLAGTAGALPVMNGAKNKAPKRTRNLARSIASEVLESDRSHVLIGIGTDVEYAALQEFGGTVTPKERQFLTVPLTEQGRQYASARNAPDLHAVMKKGGQSGVLVDPQGVAHYTLVKSVTIPAHPYLRPALDENRAAASREAGETLRQLIERAVG
jgi:HK97 gp10 family phage protein